MSNTYDLKKIEERAFKSTFQDGLWDIFLGLIFIHFALGPLLDQIGLSKNSEMLVSLGYNILMVGGLVVGKKFITTPRIGLVKFGPQRKRRLVKTRVVLLASVLLGVIVVIFFGTGNDLGRGVVLALFATNIIIVFSAMAYFMNFDRLYGYAVLFALSLPLGELLERRTGLSHATDVFWASGGIAIVVGIVLFVQFLRDHPLPLNQKEIADGGA